MKVLRIGIMSSVGF